MTWCGGIAAVLTAFLTPSLGWELVPAWDDPCTGKSIVCHQEATYIFIYNRYLQLYSPDFIGAGPNLAFLLSQAPYSFLLHLTSVSACFKELCKAGAAFLAATKDLKSTGSILHQDLGFLTSLLM